MWYDSSIVSWGHSKFILALSFHSLHWDFYNSLKTEIWSAEYPPRFSTALRVKSKILIVDPRFHPVWPISPAWSVIHIIAFVSRGLCTWLFQSLDYSTNFQWELLFCRVWISMMVMCHIVMALWYFLPHLLIRDILWMNFLS